MDNQTVLQEVRMKVSEVQEIGKKIKTLHKEIKRKEKELIKIVIPWLNEVYRQWRPQISEPVVRIDFNAMTAFELFVTDINGLNIRVREGDKNAYHRFSLHNEIKEYETPTFILPVSVYQELSNLFEFQEYPTLRYDKNGKERDETPSYFKKRRTKKSCS